MQWHAINLTVMMMMIFCRFMLLPLMTVEKNLETKVKTCEEKIKSIEV